MTARALGPLAGWIAVAAVVALLAPAVGSVDPTLHPPGEALVFGLLVGVALFLVLARPRLPPASVATLPRRRLAARAILLTAKAAQEESIWRGLVLGLLVGPLGGVGAVAVSTLLFAAAHVGDLGRVAAVHLLTGLAFAGVYLTTGRLLAAVTAHGTYNVLLGAAALAGETLSETDNGRGPGTLLASRSPSRSLPAMPDPVPSPASAPIAALAGVVKAFGSVRALDGVDLELRQGEVLALLGPNGAGKSTAVSIMLGLRRPDRGSARLFDLDPRDPDSRRRVGAVLQDVGFPPGLRVGEAVDLVRAHFDGADSRDDALARVGLSSVSERDAGGLSVGQRRRLAVALALAGRPAALFLDEPTTGMDATARRALLSDLRSYAARGGAVLLTTQQLADAEEIATRVVLLARGRVALTGSVPDVRARAGRARVTLRAATLPPVRAAAAVETQDERHVVYVDDADAFVSELVRSGTAFSDLEVVPVSLEDAFVAITAEADP